LKFGSENQLKVHNYLQSWCNWIQPNIPHGIFEKSH